MTDQNTQVQASQQPDQSTTADKIDQQKIDMYFMTNAKYFPEDKIMDLRARFANLSNSQYSIVSGIELKDPTTLLIVSILLGGLGIDRFMLGDTGLGVLKLLTGGVFGIMTIIDWFSVQKRTREKNFQKIVTMI